MTLSSLQAVGIIGMMQLGTAFALLLNFSLQEAWIQEKSRGWHARAEIVRNDASSSFAAYLLMPQPLHRARTVHFPANLKGILVGVDGLGYEPCSQMYT